MWLLYSLSLLLLLLLFTLTDLSYSIAINTSIDYLKLPLLHRTPFTSPSQALSFDIRRLSLLHHHHQRLSFKSPVISGASSGSGQYFVSLRLGSPPQTLLLVADTGSDLVWVKCSACKNCSNYVPGSAFLARHSSTFSPIHCFNSLCQFVPQPRPNPCNHSRLHSPCRYEYLYGDGSKTSGFFSRETTTLNTSTGREKRLKSLAFGCGFRISGPSLTGASFKGAHGVMGLGRAPISFSSQLGRRFGNKFSYCLMDYTLSPAPTSYLMIGGIQNNAVSKKRILKFTPLQVNPQAPTFYYIGIKSVSVDGVKLPINSSVWSIDELGNGGTIIDSGTTLTFITEPAYREILRAFKRQIKLPSAAELTPGFDLCVNVSGVSRPTMPRMSFELDGDSVFSPPSMNYFVETADRVKCLAIQPVNADGDFSVIGNLMQQGYLLEFDRDKSRLGFSRRGCAIP
ncbi:aspartyl protease family protein 2-like [Hevea brasiliensis]|uniref:aspartyl protease family protein 2-like n=1 Tax=Hevea brasiliensis TaxID=3981 RepID=UPI0025CEDC29|nr:aspartyl protease family protein 2-like [Hevea brasiliensis]